MKKEDDEKVEDLPLIIPELHYLSEKYIVRVPVTDKVLKNKWELRKYAAMMVEQKIGDEVQLTSMKVKHPHVLAKTKARLTKQVPSARLLVTVKF
jgi:hypothetical protein